MSSAPRISAFWIRDERVVAGKNVNNDIKALLASRAPIRIDRLRDAGVPLADLTRVA